MKILHVNAADVEGGAAKAALRLLHGLQGEGADVRLHVQRKSGDDQLTDGPRSLPGRIFGRLRPTIEQLLLGISPAKVKGPFCAAFLPDRLAGIAAGMAPDIIHLHWVARMMRIETLSRLKSPVVWTMHDSWPFTGGCYLPYECVRYRDSCGCCPVLDSSREDDLSGRVWERKHEAWKSLDLTVVAPSRWMGDRAKESSLFRDVRVEVIPNGIDVRLFRPLEKSLARERLSLPRDRKLILYGAKGATTDPNKGAHLLKEALQEVAGRMGDKVELLLFGASRDEPRGEFGVTVRSQGYLADEERLATLYAAADLFVFPSIEETLGYTAMEAMSCGTPCVAFQQGGVPDLVDHRENGYLARPHDAADLALGIEWVLEDPDRWRRLAAAARTKIQETFALDVVARRHLDLYREIIDGRERGGR